MTEDEMTEECKRLEEELTRQEQWIARVNEQLRECKDLLRSKMNNAHRTKESIILCGDSDAMYQYWMGCEIAAGDAFRDFMQMLNSIEKP